MVFAIKGSSVILPPPARARAAVIGVLLMASLPGATALQAQQVQSAPLPPPPAAQQPPAARPPAQQAPRPGPGATGQQGQARPAAPAANSDAPRADSGLRQRVEQLEEQLTDLQVSIGTIESMSRSGAAAGAAGAARSSAGSGADAVRVDALEQQMRQMSAQIEQLAQQVRALSAGGGGQPAAQPAPGVPPARASVAQVPSSGFGSTVVTPGSGAGSGDPIGQIIGGAQQPAQPAAATDASARQIYESGRAQLLQRDYAGAEASFDDFVRRFPNDALAGDAQYWLGESLFVRGQFKGAAAAFLKGYRTYPRSAKAPDSLMMLAISLDRLGQRDDACAAFTELGTRFPNAPGYVKNRTDSERRRIGCS